MTTQLRLSRTNLLKIHRTLDSWMLSGSVRVRGIYARYTHSKLDANRQMFIGSTIPSGVSRGRKGSRVAMKTQAREMVQLVPIIS